MASLPFAAGEISFDVIARSIWHMFPAAPHAEKIWNGKRLVVDALSYTAFAIEAVR